MIIFNIKIKTIKIIKIEKINNKIILINNNLVIYNYIAKNMELELLL